MHQPQIGRSQTFRTLLSRTVATIVLPVAMGLFVGCGWDGSTSGCEPPQAYDAGPPAVLFMHDVSPCFESSNPVRGSSPRLIASFQCPGTSSRFLAAVKVDGELRALLPVECAAYGSAVRLDLGPWEESADVSHNVEVILDPMNLFEETNEDNNRVTVQVETVEPDLGLLENTSGFTPASGPQQGLWVTEVNTGVPVNIRSIVQVAGLYPGATVTLRSIDLDATYPRDFTDCQTLWSETQVTHYWLPPAPGFYDVEFRVAPPSGSTDANSSNNVVVKRLRVFPP
jgi:hypothetical protein